MPELQGRFPIRVELKDLTRDDCARILREPRASLIVQYRRSWPPRAWRSSSPRRHRSHWPTWRIRSSIDPEHRCPPAPHDPRTGRRGDLLRVDRPRREANHDRCQVRPRSAGLRRPGRRPEPVHPLIDFPIIPVTDGRSQSRRSPAALERLRGQDRGRYDPAPSDLLKVDQAVASGILSLDRSWARSLRPTYRRIRPPEPQAQSRVHQGRWSPT